ncbi:TetR/AcrR family transcriptional regulator [Sphingomonas sp. IC4-52]|uniref:TetR/AcrR family transcriptional regulator n=1 Tax=Sphingomonas sp. IC4-52 TaxID=2887202 RepID=UPI001D1163BE|nr:hypothetical protein [Sphingomonas sp. IC4-52]MCC2981322.1 hypothetical protein [Sphingomonas sp. IC4-52]
MRDALIELLRDTRLEDVTGAQVAARAGVGYATYFRHYANVRDLLIDTVVVVADELAARMMPAMIAADTSAAARMLAREVAEHRTMFLALLRGAGDETRGMLARHIVARTAELPDLSPEWLPQRLALRLAVASTVELLDWWLCEEPDRSADDVAMLLDRLVIGPLRHG